MKTCTTNKICYYSKEEAEEALLENRVKYNYAPGAGPVNVYKCEYCGFFHFTSKGESNSRLTNKEDQKRIEREREANFWRDRFK